MKLTLKLFQKSAHATSQPLPFSSEGSTILTSNTRECFCTCLSIYIYVISLHALFYTWLPFLNISGLFSFIILCSSPYFILYYISIFIVVSILIVVAHTYTQMFRKISWLKKGNPAILTTWVKHENIMLS